MSLFSVSLYAQEHTVSKGDTIARIAFFYGVYQKDLMKLNNIRRPGKLHLGDILVIPKKLLGNARRKHIVKKGDTIFGIAKEHKVKIGALKKLNRLSKGSVLEIGRTLAIPNSPGDQGPTVEERGHGDSIPEKGRKHLEWVGGVKGLVVSGEAVNGGVKHTVQPGQTISMIARAYYTNGKELARQNKITKKNPLKTGMEIFVKGAKRPVPVRTNAYEPHTIIVIRTKKTKRVKLNLINNSGALNQTSKRVVQRLLGYRWVHPRLLELLQRAAERFPGHAIEIISGYRKHKPKKGKRRSPHARGVAVDFRLQGVSNELLYEFISSFDEVGAGYYPNSTHVHLDVRKKKYLWTDISGRGEAALYISEEDDRHWENIKNTLTDSTD